MSEGNRKVLGAVLTLLLVLAVWVLIVNPNVTGLYSLKIAGVDYGKFKIAEVDTGSLIINTEDKKEEKVNRPFYLHAYVAVDQTVEDLELTNEKELEAAFKTKTRNVDLEFYIATYKGIIGKSRPLKDGGLDKQLTSRMFISQNKVTKIEGAEGAPKIAPPVAVPQVVRVQNEVDIYTYLTYNIWTKKLEANKKDVELTKL